MRYNPYWRESKAGIPGKVDAGTNCYLIYNDDGTVATGPTGQRYCFTEAKATAIIAKLGVAKAAAAKPAASNEPSPGGDMVFPCSDGKISLFKGDIFFLADNGHHHGIVMTGANDPDRAFVDAVRTALRALHSSGQAARMSGKDLITLDPFAGRMSRGAHATPRKLNNRRE